VAAPGDAYWATSPATFWFGVGALASYAAFITVMGGYVVYLALTGN